MYNNSNDFYYKTTQISTLVVVSARKKDLDSTIHRSFEEIDLVDEFNNDPMIPSINTENKDQNDDFQKSLFSVFDDTLKTTRQKREKKGRLLYRERNDIKRPLSKEQEEEDFITLALMMRQVYKRTMESPRLKRLRSVSTNNDNDFDYDNIDMELLPLPGEPDFEFDYEYIDEAQARHKHKKKYGTSFPFNDNPATPDTPIIISSQQYEHYQLIIKDIGDTNEDLLSAHVNGRIALKNDGIGLFSDEHSVKELEIDIDIPQLGFRCCRVDDMASIEPEYHRDIRTIHFSILSKEGLKLDCKIYTKYLCERDIEDQVGQTGFFWYKLEIDNAEIHYINYKMETRDEHHERYNPLYFSAIHENSEKANEPALQKYLCDPTKGHSYPPMPSSIKGEIKVKFVIRNTKTKSSLKDEKIKVNLGPPKSPLEAIDTALKSNISHHEEL